MRPLVALALLLPLAGCAKKVAKLTGGTDDAAAAQPPAPKPKAEEKAKPAPAEKPSWLNDPRYHKPAPGDPAETPAEPNPNGKPPGWGVTAPAGGWSTPETGQLPGFPPVGPPPGGVVVAAPPAAAKPPAPAEPDKPAGRAVTRADINDVWVFIENASQSGKMPGPDLVLAALLESKSPAAELVRNGSIYLTGARVREGIWAFDRHAPTRGGWVATHNGPELLTAAEFAARATGR